MSAYICANIAMNLGNYFPNLSFDGIHDVHYIEDMSCHLCFYRWGLPYIAEVPTLWPAQKCRRLAREIVDLIYSQLRGRMPRGQHWDVDKVRWLAPGVGLAGCCKKTQRDRVYIQTHNIRHPFDLVSTVLHELGHQLIYRTPHYMRCSHSRRGHCSAWQKAVKLIMAIFAVSLNVLSLIQYVVINMLYFISFI